MTKIPQIGETISPEDFNSLPEVGQTISASQFSNLPNPTQTSPEPQRLSFLQKAGNVATGVGKFLGMENLGKGIGLSLSRLTPEITQLEQKIQNGTASDEELAMYQKQFQEEAPTNKQVLASAVQTAGSIFPFTKTGSTFMQAGGRLLPQMAKSAALGGILSASQSLQKPESNASGVLKDTLVGTLIGGTVPLAGMLISRGLKSISTFPEKLYNQIFKQAQDDLAEFYKTGALQDLQNTNPDQFTKLLGKGIIKVAESGKIEINPTLAREALDKGLMGSSENMAKYSYLKQLELEDKVRQIATPENLITLDNKKGYSNLLKFLTKEFKGKNFGFFPERLETANALSAKLDSVKGNKIDAETALKLRRYLDGLRATKSFSDPFSPLSQKQEVLKESANNLRGTLARIPGIKNLMNDYRFFIDAFDSIVEDAVKRQNTKLLNLTDLIVGGGGMASGFPGTGLGAAAGIRAFQQPSVLTATAKGLDIVSKTAQRARPIFGNVPGAIPQTQLPTLSNKGE